MDNTEHAQKAQEIYDFLCQSKWFSGVKDLREFSAQIYSTFRTFYDVFGIVKIAEGYLWLHDGVCKRTGRPYTDFKMFLWNWLKNEANGGFKNKLQKHRKEDHETGGQYKSKSNVISSGGEPKAITKKEVRQIQKVWEAFKSTGQIELNFEGVSSDEKNND